MPSQPCEDDLQDLLSRPTLSIPEVASILGVGVSTAYQAARDASVPTIRIGRRLLVPTAAVRRMLQLEGGEREQRHPGDSRSVP